LEALSLCTHSREVKPLFIHAEQLAREQVVVNDCTMMPLLAPIERILSVRY
jgi:hypothetical protein